MQSKILIMGLPGAGKTALASALAPLLNAVVFNADAVRANLSRDLGFSHEDRVEHARRMGWMCDRVVEAGGTVIADFICPTAETRTAFGEAFVIWVDRIDAGRFEDTNRMFVAPERYDIRVTAEGAPQYWAELALARLRPAFDPQKPTALFIGRYQPFHHGHQRLMSRDSSTGGVGGFQILVLALCLIVMIIDGFDAQAVGFVAPLISMEWAVPKASFSAVFAAGLLGMALGALLFGALADRFGRKIILVLCSLAFGTLTIGKAFASSTLALTVLQLLAGLGIGGAMPNAIALVSEYAPVKRRSLMIAVATAGYSVGASGAGFLTARLAAVYGWQATFLVGGIAALAMVPALIALLPESIRFMALSGAQPSKLISILRKIDPRLPAQLDFTLTSSEHQFAEFPVAHLFREGRSGMTVLLWLAVLMDLLVIYYMTSWLPVTIHGVGGISVEDAAIAAALFSAAGVVGAPVVGQMMDRFGPVRMWPIS
jgi:MFS family permease